jgi:hypothetical protein
MQVSLRSSTGKCVQALNTWVFGPYCDSGQLDSSWGHGRAARSTGQRAGSYRVNGPRQATCRADATQGEMCQTVGPPARRPSARVQRTVSGGSSSTSSTTSLWSQPSPKSHSYSGLLEIRLREEIRGVVVAAGAERCVWLLDHPIADCDHVMQSRQAEVPGSSTLRPTGGSAPCRSRRNGSRGRRLGRGAASAPHRACALEDAGHPSPHQRVKERVVLLGAGAGDQLLR